MKLLFVCSYPSHQSLKRNPRPSRLLTLLHLLVHSINQSIYATAAYSTATAGSPSCLMAALRAGPPQALRFIAKLQLMHRRRQEARVASWTPCAAACSTAPAGPRHGASAPQPSPAPISTLTPTRFLTAANHPAGALTPTRARIAPNTPAAIEVGLYAGGGDPSGEYGARTFRPSISFLVRADCAEHARCPPHYAHPTGPNPI